MVKVNCLVWMKQEEKDRRVKKERKIEANVLDAQKTKQGNLDITR
jgi:hypothetical protein